MTGNPNAGFLVIRLKVNNRVFRVICNKVGKPDIQGLICNSNQKGWPDFYTK